MAFAAGVYTLPAGNPVVSGTTIQSSWANTTLSDIATALSTCVLKDGTQTLTANIPMSNFKLTGLGAGTASTDSVRLGQLQNSTVAYLTGTAGTNTVTASASPTLTALAAGQVFRLIPANTNTAATTLQIDSTAATNVFWNGAALVGGEIRQNVPIEVFYDGTQYQLIASAAMLNVALYDDVFRVRAAGDATKLLAVSLTGITAGNTRTLTMPDENVTLAAATSGARGTIQLASTAEVLTGTDSDKAVTALTLQNGKSANGTVQATSSGTAYNFTIPSWAKQITVTMTDVSLAGAGNVLVQLGDAGGIETGSYSGVTGGGSVTLWDGAATLSSGFEMGNGAGASLSGSIILTLHNSATNTWVAQGVCGQSGDTSLKLVGGYKSLSQALTTVRFTVTASSFDAGGVNVFYI